jgi:Tfp pilus tip-associated adhesin PilY1
MGTKKLSHSRIRRTLLGAFALTLVVPGTAGLADDSDLFATRVPPNVLLFVDESGSMTNIMQHPYFDASNAPFTMSNSTDCEVISLSDSSTTWFPDDSSTTKYIRLATGGSSGHRFEPRSSETSGWTATATALDDPSQGYVERTYCGHVRKIYTDPNLDSYTRTLWVKLYLDWYFHLEDNVVYDHPDPNNPETKTGAEIIAEIESHDSGRDYITGDYIPQYQISRMTAAQNVANEVMYRTNSDCPAYAGAGVCTDFHDRVRFGIARFRSGSHGGYVSAAPVSYTTGKSSLDTAVDAFSAGGSTPLAETLFQLYTYFMERGDSVDRPVGLDSTEFPSYEYKLDGTHTTGSDYAPDPYAWDCQKQFVIMITDGAPTSDNFSTSGSVTLGFSTFRAMIGDYAPDLASEDDWDQAAASATLAATSGVDDWTVTSTGKEEGSPPWSSSSSTGYLDDIAKFMADTDARDDIANKQTIDVYTVGFTTVGPVNTLLAKTARNGNGEFFPVSQADELTESLTNAIDEIIEKSMSFTAATVPASRTTDGDNFYTSFFLPKPISPYWEGHLKNFEFTALGDILTDDGYCATGDAENVAPSPTCPTSGVLRTTASAFWDAALEMPDPGSRNLFVEFGNTSMFNQPSRWNTTNVSDIDLGIIDGVDELDEPYLSAGLTVEADIAAAVIGVASGCEFNSSPCVPRTNDASEKTYLGDIFHSNPMVVGSPNAPVNESSYHAFATSHRTRTRVIYAGANDGFLHGFNAGDWQTKEKDANGNLTNVDLIPPRHDHGTGEELFGFMPYPVRNKIKDLPKEEGAQRAFETVDGSPIVADAWFYRTVSGGNLTSVNPLLTEADKVADQWRTVMIGGLRDGGRAYYALDVSDPTAAASDVSSDYPRYLWGFPCENATAFCSGTANLPGSLTYADFMGYTWSEPVITRVRVSADTGLDPRGYERWVAVFGAGYDPKSDPNKKPSADPYDVNDLGGRAIFMVDITTGDVLAMKHFDADDEFINSEQIGFKEMKYAFASAPAVFDLDFDGFADVIYIGDVGGNLWKWVVSPIGDDPINNTVSDDNIAQPNWPFRLFFQGSPSASPPERQDPPGAYDDTIHYQSFFFPPTGVLRNGSLILAFGAGERAEAVGLSSRYNDGSTSDNNHYYVVKDSDPVERSGSSPDPITDALGEADLADFDDPTPLDCGVMKSTKEGYYITARDAEKFITNSVVFMGTVFTASYLPPDPATVSDPCSSTGSAYLYAFDIECGIGKFTSNPGGVEEKRRKAVGDGIPTRPRVSVGDLNQGGNNSGCKNKVVVITSDGNISNDCPGTLPGSGISVRSWRER